MLDATLKRTGSNHNDAPSRFDAARLATHLPAARVGDGHAILGIAPGQALRVPVHGRGCGRFPGVTAQDFESLSAPRSTPETNTWERPGARALADAPGASVGSAAGAEASAGTAEDRAGADRVGPCRGKRVNALTSVLRWSQELELGGLTRADIARREGTSRARVAQLMELQRLSEGEQQAILQGDRVCSIREGRPPPATHGSRALKSAQSAGPPRNGPSVGVWRLLAPDRRADYAVRRCERARGPKKP